MENHFGESLSSRAQQLFRKSLNFTLVISAFMMATSAHAVPIEFNDRSAGYLDIQLSMAGDSWACSDTGISGGLAVTCQINAVIDFGFDSAQLLNFNKYENLPAPYEYSLLDQQGTIGSILTSMDLKVYGGVLSGFRAAGDGVFLSAGNYEPITSVPEPGSLGLLGISLVALGLLGRRRKA